jgi:predicted RNase H-like HicB family nuclease
MALAYYRALLVQDEGDGPGAEYGVIFPDLPGCTSSGVTRMDAARQAAEALAGHIDLLAEQGDALPQPSDVGSALPSWLDDVGVVVGEVLVPVEMPGRAVRANITVDEGLLRRIDTAARAAGNTRSGFLADAARAWFRRERFDWAEKRARDLQRQLELLRSGKMRSVENHGRGEIDTTADNIKRIEGWLAELDELKAVHVADAAASISPEGAP